MAMSRALALVVAVAFAASAAALDTVTVRPPAGPITGYVTDKARQFRGVYYAEPPTDSLRWQPPVMRSTFTSAFNATMNGPGCPQPCGPPKLSCPPVTSEDCLLMNIYTPRGTTADSNLPVMMFIHGGQFHTGFAGMILYDGDNFVNHTGVVLAVIQYRLGALGFLYTGNGISGNYGILDQKLALEWLHKNIGAFGGDPNEITVFGQSAGAMSIGAQLISPAFKGLYKRAILESEPFGIPFRDAATWTDFAKDFAKAAGCDTSGNYDSCLMGVNASTLVTAATTARKDVSGDLSNLFQLFVPWTPTVGTELVPSPPLNGWRDGQVHDIPIMIGTVQNEGVLFVYEAFTKPVSKTEYDILLGLLFGIEDAIEIGERYPVGNNTVRATAAEVATRCLFRCTTRNASLSVDVSSGRSQPLFNYVFDHVASFNKFFWGPKLSFCWDKVCHGADLPFVFAPNASQYGIYFQPDEIALSLQIQTYWSNFAKTSNPGTANGVNWPAYTPTTRETIRLATPADADESKAFEFCNFWDSLGYPWAEPKK